jgi:hypothetical protein
VRVVISARLLKCDPFLVVTTNGIVVDSGKVEVLGLRVVVLIRLFILSLLVTTSGVVDSWTAEVISWIVVA